MGHRLFGGSRADAFYDFGDFCDYIFRILVLFRRLNVFCGACGSHSSCCIGGDMHVHMGIGISSQGSLIMISTCHDSSPNLPTDPKIFKSQLILVFLF